MRNIGDLGDSPAKRVALS